MSRQAALINPIKVQNYKEEGLVGRLTAIWAGCAAGGYLRNVQYFVCLKYLLGLFLELGIPWKNNYSLEKLGFSAQPPGEAGLFSSA